MQAKLSEYDSMFREYLIQCVNFQETKISPERQLVLIGYIYHSLNPAANQCVIFRRLSKSDVKYIGEFLAANDIKKIGVSAGDAKINKFRELLTEVPELLTVKLPEENDSKLLSRVKQAADDYEILVHGAIPEGGSKTTFPKSINDLISKSRLEYEKLSISDDPETVISWEVPEEFFSPRYSGSSSFCTYIKACRILVSKFVGDFNQRTDKTEVEKAAANLIAVHIANRKSEILFGALTKTGESAEPVKLAAIEILKIEGYQPSFSYFVSSKSGDIPVREADIPELSEAQKKMLLTKIHI